eukprot:277975-Rhodomonas_salina.1
MKVVVEAGAVILDSFPRCRGSLHHAGSGLSCWFPRDAGRAGAASMQLPPAPPLAAPARRPGLSWDRAKERLSTAQRTTTDDQQTRDQHTEAQQHSGCQNTWARAPAECHRENRQAREASLSSAACVVASAGVHATTFDPSTSSPTVERVQVDSKFG